MALNNPTVQGHREVNSTACPGRNAFERLGELRGNAAGVAENVAAPAFPGILSSGASGADVCRVQTRLRVQGQSIDQISGCPFGPQTEAAVKAFQRDHGLDADGVVGPLTWGALFA